MKRTEKNWSVEVRCNGAVVVTIETRCLSGRDLSEADEDLIRDCAAHLLAFVGPRKAPEFFAKAHPCDHKFVDSTRCLKCGWQP